VAYSWVTGTLTRCRGRKRRNRVFRKIEDFQSAYGQMAEGTAKVFAQLDESNINQAVAPGHRTLGQLAWHIVTTIPEMMNRTGLGLSSVDPHSMPPASPSQIVPAHKAATEEMMKAIAESWSDETLLEKDDMYGQQWLRGLTLAAIIEHEAHHRGEMIVLLRQAGTAVPGLYGPSKEEWSQYGMEAPPY
jgi:uncharacterized damage-inducible protein DinB